MASSPNTKAVKIHERCHVYPQLPSPQSLSLPLTFFDLIWLRLPAVEFIFFYSLPTATTEEVVPKLKASLSLALQHYLPLAGNIVWNSDSNKPEIQYPGDGVPLTVAESTHQDLKGFVDNSPRPASESRCLVPELDSSDSRASVISLQITIFPNNGFCIGISAHHAVVDGKSLIMFVKAWARLSQQISTNNDPSLDPELVPLLDREAIKDPNGRDVTFINGWTEYGGRSLKILYDAIPPLVDNACRATFELTRGDLEKIREKVLSMWDTVAVVGEEVAHSSSSLPPRLSTFVLTCAYVSACIARATEEAEKKVNSGAAKSRFAFLFIADCRARLDPPVPDNYFGDCICSHLVDATNPSDFVQEHGVVVVAKKIHSKIKQLDGEGLLDGMETLSHRLMLLKSEGIQLINVGSSTRFGVYGADFGWGKPAKVEITSVDRGVTIGMAESKDGSGGVEVGLVLNEHVMAIFHQLFLTGLRF